MSLGRKSDPERQQLRDAGQSHQNERHRCDLSTWRVRSMCRVRIWMSTACCFTWHAGRRCTAI